MGFHNYKVYFAHTSTGKDGRPIASALSQVLASHGARLPRLEIGSDLFQVRDLVRVGSVWKGVFAKLRPDALNIVDHADDEHEIDLNVGDRFVDKTHFLYREHRNILVWQVNRNAGGLAKLGEYFSRLLDEVCVFPLIMNQAELRRVLESDIRTVSFAYARPASLETSQPSWNQRAFDVLADVHAAEAKFEFKAPRKGKLKGHIKALVKQLAGSDDVRKLRVHLTDDSDPVELFMAPLKDTIRVQLKGRYPVEGHAHQELEAAYDRNKNQLTAPD